MSKNKIKYGLKNVHYATFTEVDGVVTYDDPVRLRGGVSISLSAEGDESTFYADDIPYFQTISNNGYSGDLEVALITDDFRVDVLGDLKDENGVIFEDSQALSKPIALLFEFSGDEKNMRRVLYNVTVARPNIEGETRSEAIDPQAETLSLLAGPSRETGYTTAKCETGDVPYDEWYTDVYTFDDVVA